MTAQDRASPSGAGLSQQAAEPVPVSSLRASIPDAMRCIVCGANLRNLDENGNQPSGGTAFQTKGHFGSTVFDPMDGTCLEINVCDPCLLDKAKSGAVLRYGAWRSVVRNPPKRWRGPREDRQNG